MSDRIAVMNGGETVQASIANTGESTTFASGTPVAVHVPVDALRVLAPSEAPAAVSGEVTDEPERAPVIAT